MGRVFVLVVSGIVRDTDPMPRNKAVSVFQLALLNAVLEGHHELFARGLVLDGCFAKHLPSAKAVLAEGDERCPGLMDADGFHSMILKIHNLW